MLTFSSRSLDHPVECQEDEIVLTGRPAFLKGHLTLENHTGDTVFVRDLPIKSQSRSLQNPAESLQVNTAMQPGEVRSQKVLLSLDSRTPPGTYHFQMPIGGRDRAVRVVVQENLAIKINPTKVHLTGVAPGMTHIREIQLSNVGNLPFMVPSIRHNTMLDMDLFCRNFALATRKKAKEGFEVWADALIEGIGEDLADWVDIQIRESGQVVQPGQTISLHVTFTLPKDIDPGRSYEGNIRIHDRSLSYYIFAAPAADKPTPPVQSKPAVLKPATSTTSRTSSKPKK